jgi:very-short-patch-repair endonuclease
MSNPKGKIASWMRTYFQEGMWNALNVTIGDTPIENTLFVAIEAWLYCHQMTMIMRRCGGQYGPPKQVFDKYPKVVFLFEPQAQIENYRVDFAFYQRGEQGVRTLIVECDGHDFHERTKEQAIADRSRDRRLQELGYTVYRFTGSEIYNDPIKCAEQLMAWVDEP